MHINNYLYFGESVIIFWEQHRCVGNWGNVRTPRCRKEPNEASKDCHQLVLEKILRENTYHYSTTPH